MSDGKRRPWPMQADLLWDVASALAVPREGDALTAALMALLRTGLFPAAALFELDRERGVLRRLGAVGVPDALPDEAGWTLTDTAPAARAAREGTVQVGGPRSCAGGRQESTPIAVPLHTGNGVAGVLLASVAGSAPPADAALAELQAVAPLFALALENHRLRRQAEREQGRARFLLDVGQAFAASLNIEHVLEGVAAAAVQVLADWCVIYLLDRVTQLLEMRVVYHPDPARAAIVRRVFRDHPLRVGEGVAGQVVLDRRPRLFAPFDEAAIAALAPRDDPAYQAELRRVRAWACLPLIARDQAIGALVVARTRDEPFTDTDLALAAAFADRAALSIENARLFADAERRAREADFLAETTALAGSVADPRALLERLARQALQMLGEGCGIFLTARARRWLPAATIVHRDPHHEERLRRLLLSRPMQEDGPVIRRLLSGELIVINGQQQLLANARTPAARDFFATFGVHALIAIGLGTKEEPLGVMVCVRQDPHGYSAEDARLTRLLAERVTAALTNALLHAQVAAERQRLAAVIEQLPEGVLIAAAPDGRLILSNRAADDLLGRSATAPADVFPGLRLLTAEGQPVPEAELPLARALRGENVHGEELWVERPDGRRIPILINAAPVLGSSHGVEQAVVVFQDITAIKEAERRKDEWLAAASHELRTPVTSLLGFAQLLERQLRRASGPLQPEDLFEPVTVIQRQARRLRELVNDLLDVSRVQAGRLELQPRPVDLIELVRAVIGRLRELTPRAGERLHLTAPATPVIGMWDPERLDQVFTNLIANALKYDPSGGPIQVVVRAEERQVTVEVTDAGIGIPASDLPALFRPFARARNAVAQGMGGIGLGLYIARDIVARHGGEIRLASEEGRGTTVTVTLPLDGRPHPPAAPTGA